jgi:hypothetical protein
LVLAILLYQCEHGKLPDEHWVEALKAADGGRQTAEDWKRWFSCPTHPAPKGETTYALVQYGDTLPENPDTIILVELAEAVPLDKAVISADEVLELIRLDDKPRGQRRVKAHPGIINVAYRSGAVRVLSESVEEAELLRLLGR